jgi:hypothetical protein
VGDGAEDPESAGVGHRRHDVTAVAESAYRELNTEQFGDSGSHCTTLKFID